MTAFNVFHFEEGASSFEDFAQHNGTQFWFASDLARFLEYESFEAFQKVLNKAIGVCMTLNIPVLQNFEQTSTSSQQNDYKFSRFACMLTAMNADPSKLQVASAQAYFAAMADVGQSMFAAETSDRVLTRDELTKSLKTYKGLSGEAKPLDFMGSQELAANLFRVTQTSAKIVRENISGQPMLEKTAHNVGQTVRRTMQEISNTTPENLPLTGDINESKKTLKSAQKKLNKLSGGSPKKVLPGSRKA